MNNRAVVAGFLSMCISLSAGCADGGDDHDDVEDRNGEIVENLLAAGFSAEEIEVREAAAFAELADGELALVDPELGELELQVFVDGDVRMTLEASRELLDGGGDGSETFRHWRTPNLVDNNKTICLAKVTTAAGAFSSYELTADMKTGVDKAKKNYNDLTAFGLTFKVGNASLNGSGKLSHGISGCDFTTYIYKVNGEAGGSAGFPSGGAPYEQIQLNSGLAGLSVDVHEHVATHEIGHTIGMRHTDWKTRSSCGQNTKEGKRGASQIPGTANQTTNSIMAACFDFGTNGELRGEDAEAFKKIY